MSNTPRNENPMELNITIEVTNTLDGTVTKQTLKGNGIMLVMEQPEALFTTTIGAIEPKNVLKMFDAFQEMQARLIAGNSILQRLFIHNMLFNGFPGFEPPRAQREAPNTEGPRPGAPDQTELDAFIERLEEQFLNKGKQS